MSVPLYQGHRRRRLGCALASSKDKAQLLGSWAPGSLRSSLRARDIRACGGCRALRGSPAVRALGPRATPARACPALTAHWLPRTPQRSGSARQVGYVLGTASGNRDVTACTSSTCFVGPARSCPCRLQAVTQQRRASPSTWQPTGVRGSIPSAVPAYTDAEHRHSAQVTARGCRGKIAAAVGLCPQRS